MKEKLSILKPPISKLKEILKPGSFLFLDIDGTVKDPKTIKSPSGFNPDLPILLHQLQNSGVVVGTCTSQSPQEFWSFLKEQMQDTSLFSGINIFEDGHIIVEPNKNISTEYQILASPDYLQQIAKIKSILPNLIKPSDDPQLQAGNWGFFPFVATPVALPEGKYQGVATISIWEKGPDIHDSSYQNQYDSIKAFVSGIVCSLHLDNITLFEAGNGTLRIIQNGFSKANALLLLSENNIIDLSQCVYVGDGLNDIAPASLIKNAGGGVIAVGNSIDGLSNLATYVCQDSFSHGVVEALTKITSQ